MKANRRYTGCRLAAAVAAAALAGGVLASELPFKATLKPFRGEWNSSRVNVLIENESTEPITGVVVTRNNGGLFTKVVATGGGVNGTFTSPTYEISSLDNSGVGYIREYWYNSGYTENTPPSWIYGQFKPQGPYEPFERGIIRTGDFAAVPNAADRFGERLHGYLKAPETAVYKFRLQVDDCAYVVMYKLNALKTGVVTNLLFNETWSANQGAWHDSAQTVALEKGEVVYLEAYHIEGGGADNLNLKWAPGIPEYHPETVVTNNPALMYDRLLMTERFKNGTFVSYYGYTDVTISGDLRYEGGWYLWDWGWREKCVWQSTTYDLGGIDSVYDAITNHIHNLHVQTIPAHTTTNFTFAAVPAPSFSTQRPAEGTAWASPLWPDIIDDILVNVGESNTIRIKNISNFKAGDKINFDAILKEASLAPQGALWNLPAGTAKTTIQVFGAYGNSSTLELGSTEDTAENVDYVFKTEARPLSLRVESVDAVGNIIKRAGRFKVKIVDPTQDSASPNYVVEELDNITNAPNDTAVFVHNQLRSGMQVSFEAVGEIYFDQAGKFVYDTYTEATATNKEASVERFVASGLSVNNTVQTGDPTRYSFEIDKSTTISLRWRQDFALEVQSDFTKTASLLRSEGTDAPWAGPLTEQSAGTPSPTAGVKHWIEAGTQITAQIDSAVVDQSRAVEQLNIRYVPYGYIGTGAARGDVPAGSQTTYTNLSWASPTQAEERRQVNFAMDGPGSLRYLWKIQFGVYAYGPDLSLRKVYHKVASGAWAEVDPLLNVYWFDQGEQVRILAAANQGGADSQALTGWMLGDTYYFASDGVINTQTGALEGGTAITTVDGSPVAEWLSEVSTNAIRYRGLEIAVLKRPAAVTWSYGKQVFYDPNLQLGEYMLQGRTAPLERYAGVVERLKSPPSYYEPAESAKWDANAKVFFPVKPGEIKAYFTNDLGGSFEVRITANWPSQPHYRHIAGTPPVKLTPEDGGVFQFVSQEYTEAGTGASIQNTSEFVASGGGWTVLRFKEIKKIGRSAPKEYIVIRTVRTKALVTSLGENADGAAIIGKAVRDPLDLAGFGSGYLVYQDLVRYNPAIYNRDALSALTCAQVYDMALLKALTPQKVILHPEALPGPIIPVNLYPAGAPDTQRIIVTWYDDPVLRDGILWPYAARRYSVRWPVKPEEGLGRIVIASEWGSESLSAGGAEQIIAPADGDLPAATTFDPTRFAELKVYQQPDAGAAGYNPNEEHALLAPSFRYADVSPRPNAVYALRAGDLNNYGGTATSEPRVLVQFYDNVAQTYDMRVFTVVKEDAGVAGHFFARQGDLVENTLVSGAALYAQPHKTMEAGEPVIPFYPLGVVEGAVPCPESVGTDLKGQKTIWKDHKNSRWAVSGGTNAWFAVKAFYPLQPDFWWPAALTGATLLNGEGVAPQIGASVAFLPPDLGANKRLPTKILYKADWPRIAPVLKAGETLTFSGGEYRADHPTITVPAADGVGTETIQTPGLPAVVAFAVTEVVFDDMNPESLTDRLTDRWTVRAAQVLETRRVALPNTSFPDELRPAAGRSSDYKGKYVFNELPASLQKRVKYDPVVGVLEMKGFVNEKSNTDTTLTASPGAVYVLEPNILTEAERSALAGLSENDAWRTAVSTLGNLTRNPNGLNDATYGNGRYSVGLQPKVARNEYGIASNRLESGVAVPITDPSVAENARSFGVGTALIPNGGFLDPRATGYPEVSWVTVAENNDPSMGGSPVTLHVVKVDRKSRFRGAIKVVMSDNVFDENVVLRHSGDFGANVDGLVYEWWYRPDDGALNVPPPYSVDPDSAGDWKLFPDLSGQNGRGRNEVLLKGDPNAPETLIADSWWYVRYRHTNDVVSGSDWAVLQPDNSSEVNYTWAGAGNSDPFHDYDMNGVPDYKAQLSMGWIKRVLDAMNPYEARIADFTGDAPTTISSMLQQLGPRYEGAVALNPDKNVIENVGLIELYQTVLNRASDLSINLSSPVSTPAIANALQLASTRLSDFYMLLGNEAYVDAKDPTIGYGSSSAEYGAAAPSVFAFQNQVSSVLEEEMVLLRGQDDNMARPVFNRMFWNFTKGEGEAAYAMNYNISDINKDGFINEDDAMALYPQGHGDAWGHYLTALTQQYSLLRHPYFNWVSRSEFYNLNDVVMKVDFLDERKFAAVAAQKAKAGAEIVTDTYRDYYVEDPTAQWQGYTDVNEDRAWGVQDWARRAGQGAYFDWITANALLPSVHPNETLTGIQKVDRQENADIRVISANMNQIQATFDDANSGFNPLRISSQAVPFDINPYLWDDGVFGRTYFEQIYDRAVAALNNAKAAWDVANAAQNRLRGIANTEQAFRNEVYQQDITYKNQLIEIFGRPYPGTVGSGKFYPDGYAGPDLAYYAYVAANSVNADTLPSPSASLDDIDALAQTSDLLNNYDRYSPLAWDKSSNLERISTLFGHDATITIPILGIEVTASVSNNALDQAYYDLSVYDLDQTDTLANYNFSVPVTASTYTFLAPSAWGDRPAVGELQAVIAEMLQVQITVADTLASYDDMLRIAGRTIELAALKFETTDRVVGLNAGKKVLEVANEVASRLKDALLDGMETAIEVTADVEGISDKSIPANTPTAGLSFSLGDALAPVKGTVKAAATVTKHALSTAGKVIKYGQIAFEVLNKASQALVEFYISQAEHQYEAAELLVSMDDIFTEEAPLRLKLMSQAEQLRSLDDKYRSILNKGIQIIDEREAFNKKVAAMVQQNRYQDMTFRVERNHALENYNRLLEIAARYTYLAAKAYDYDTNFDPDAPGSPSALFAEIIKARTIGVVDGAPQVGDGLAGLLAHMNVNYQALKGQLGLTNPQIETGKLSLRSEKFRVFPKGYVPTGDTTGWSGQPDAEANWRQILENARVADLWQVPEFRYLARPFGDSVDASGNAIAEPGIVLRFSSTVTAGQNFFGNSLAGGDHAYDPSVYATRIRSVGVWFSDYLSTDVLGDLSTSPRVYLIPTGADVMSIPNASTPTKTRVWNVVDQLIPVPLPGIESKLPYSNFVPLLDSLDGRIGQQRRFSSFRAYHDSGEAVNTDELVNDSRLVGRSVWNTGWTLIIPGRALNADPDEGLDRFIEQVSDIKLVFQTYGFSGY